MDREEGDHQERGGPGGRLDRQRQEHRGADMPVPRARPGRLEHAIDEPDGRVDRLDTMEQGHRLLEPGQLPAALGAAVQMGRHLAPLLGREGVVQVGGEALARVVARHGRKRSSLSRRSARARCNRERTVPSSRSSTSAISS